MADEFKDRKLECLKCHKEFTWTAGEQRFYAEKGLKNEPKLCPTCRKERNKNKPLEVRCQVCGSKGYIKLPPEEREKFDIDSVICQKCLEAASASNT